MKENNILKRIGLFLFTVLLIFASIAVTMNRDLLNMDGFRRWLLYGDLELSLYGESNAFAHGGGNKASFALLETGAVLVSQSGSRYYSFYGDVFAERVVSFTNPILHTGENASVLYDAGGRWLAVYGDETEKFSLSSEEENPIISARMSQKDWLVVVTQESGFKGVVTVYDNQFQPVMNISLSTTYVTDAYLSPDNKHVAVVSVGQTDGIFETNLMIYNVNDMTDTPKATLNFPGKLILDVDYESDGIYLLCEDELYVVDQNFNQKTWSFDGQYLKDADLGGDGYATILLGKYRAGTADRLVTVNAQCEIIAEHALTSSPLALSASGRYVACLTGGGFLLLTSDLEEYATLEDIRHANEVTVSQDGSVLLASQQEAWLFLPF